MVLWGIPDQAAHIGTVQEFNSWLMAMGGFLKRATLRALLTLFFVNASTSLQGNLPPS
jgi:hypothetical protein